MLTRKFYKTQSRMAQGYTMRIVVGRLCCTNVANRKALLKNQQSPGFLFQLFLALADMYATFFLCVCVCVYEHRHTHTH